MGDYSASKSDAFVTKGDSVTLFVERLVFKLKFTLASPGWSGFGRGDDFQDGALDSLVKRPIPARFAELDAQDLPEGNCVTF